MIYQQKYIRMKKDRNYSCTRSEKTLGVENNLYLQTYNIIMLCVLQEDTAIINSSIDSLLIFKRAHLQTGEAHLFVSTPFHGDHNPVFGYGSCAEGVLSSFAALLLKGDA